MQQLPEQPQMNQSHHHIKQNRDQLTGNTLGLQFPTHANLDGSIFDGLGYFADRSDGSWSEAREALRLVIVTRCAQDGSISTMASIENTSEFFVVAQERVCLVEQQRRPILLDRAEDDRRRHA